MPTIDVRNDAMGAQIAENRGVPCLALRGLCKHFGGLQAVKDLTLEVQPGDRIGVLGPNGAGKTTLFHLITGVLPPTSGQILLFGQDVTRWPPHRRTALGMARTFQITTLFPRLTVLENVLLAVQGRRRMKFVMWRSLLSYREVYTKARALLEGMGFWDRQHMEIRHLSHGEQRHLEIVLALASDPQLLLLDEPAAGLSTGESQQMAALLRRLDPRLAILLIEHDMDVAFAVVDSITVLHYGEIVEAGSLDQVRASPRVRDIYLGSR
jgi:branched-chain amino acid transport system ATP-binding protein